MIDHATETAADAVLGFGGTVAPLDGVEAASAMLSTGIRSIVDRLTIDRDVHNEMISSRRRGSEYWLADAEYGPWGTATRYEQYSWVHTQAANRRAILYEIAGPEYGGWTAS